MCGPAAIGIAAGALAVGSAVTGAVGTNQAYHANEAAANYNYANDLTAISQKSAELDQQKSENAADTAITAAQTSGRIAASASDQGLGAPSIISSLNAGMFGIGRQVEAQDINDQNARTQLADDVTSADIRRQTQINSKPRVGGVQLALGVGEGILKGFSAGQSASRASTGG